MTCSAKDELLVGWAGPNSIPKQYVRSLFAIDGGGRPDFSSNGQGTRGPAVLKMPGGARAVGVGGSCVAVADDASATQWNPAGLQRVSEKEVQLMSAQLFAGQRQQSVMYAHPAWRARRRETWGVNATLLDVDSFDVRQEGEFVGSARPQEGAAGVSYAHALWGASWGATGKVVRAETYQQSGTAYQVDLGFMGPGMTDRWSWGLVLSNLGTPLALGAQKISPPTVLRLGGAWKKAVSDRGSVLITGQVDGEVKDNVEERAGAEYALRVNSDWTAVVKAGVQTGGLDVSRRGWESRPTGWTVFLFRSAPRTGPRATRAKGKGQGWASPSSRF